LSSAEATEIGSVRCSLIAATVQAYQRLLSACAQHLAAGVEDENPEIAEGEGATRLYNLTHGPQLFPFGWRQQIDLEFDGEDRAVGREKRIAGIAACIVGYRTGRSCVEKAVLLRQSDVKRNLYLNATWFDTRDGCSEGAHEWLSGEAVAYPSFELDVLRHKGGWCRWASATPGSWLGVSRWIRRKIGLSIAQQAADLEAVLAEEFRSAELLCIEVIGMNRPCLKRGFIGEGHMGQPLAVLRHEGFVRKIARYCHDGRRHALCPNKIFFSRFRAQA
jgi:hypothetical protein